MMKIILNKQSGIIIFVHLIYSTDRDIHGVEHSKITSANQSYHLDKDGVSNPITILNLN